MDLGSRFALPRASGLQLRIKFNGHHGRAYCIGADDGLLPAHHLLLAPRAAELVHQPATLHGRQHPTQRSKLTWRSGICIATVLARQAASAPRLARRSHVGRSELIWLVSVRGRSDADTLVVAA